jgi:hypothetical protein
MRRLNIPAAALAAACILLGLLLASCSTLLDPTPGEVHLLPRKALDIALTKVDAPYVWGAQGPREFDCSGLILYAYAEALGYSNFLVDENGARVDDATMDTLYRYNVDPLGPDEALPGDLVFITSSATRITHGGLFIGLDTEGGIRFLNASSFFGKVVVDGWPLQGLKREQWLVGFGRLRIQPRTSLLSTITETTPEPEPVQPGN